MNNIELIKPESFQRCFACLKSRKYVSIHEILLNGHFLHFAVAAKMTKFREKNTKYCVT